MTALSACALALFAVKTLKTLLLYPPKVGSGLKGAMMASVAGLALTHTVGKAMLMGIFTSRCPFMRTPKSENVAPLKQMLRVAWQETALFTACMVAVAGTVSSRGLGDPATLLWVIMLLVQALPYGATVLTAFLSAAANRLPVPMATPEPAPASTPEPLPEQQQAA